MALIDVIVDYVRFTVFYADSNEGEDMTEDIIRNILRLDIGKMTEYKGQYGYTRKLSFNGIGVFDGGRDDMGVMVQMAGKACRIYESYIDGFNWLDFFVLIESYGCNVSRLDIAIDEYEGLLDMDRIIKYIENKLFISKFRRYKPITEKLIKDSKRQSNTIYFGSRTSLCMFRLYDKLLERMAREKKSQYKKWVRLEMELKDDRANAFIYELLNKENFGNIGFVAVKVINNYMRFVEKNDKEKNRSRLQNAAWWDEFINTSEKLKLSKGTKNINDIEDLCNWLEKSVAGTLKLVKMVKGEFYINRLIRNAVLSEKQQIIYKDYINL